MYGKLISVEEALAKEGHISYGTNVKEVTTQVKEASVDCGVIYKTDATSAKLQMVGEATEEMCGGSIGLIDNAAINGRFFNLCGNFLDIGSV